MRRKGAHPGRDRLPARRRLAARRVRRRDQGGGRRRRRRRWSARLTAGVATARISCSIRGRAEGYVEGARVGRGRGTADPRPRGRLAGLGGLGRRRPSGSATTCATSASCSTGTATTRTLYGHFGQGCVHTPHRLSTCRRRQGGEPLPHVPRARRPIWSSRYGGSLSGEHGDGQARGELLPRDVRPRAGARPSASSRRIWDPDMEDEPGQGSTPSRCSTRTCGSAPATTRCQVETHFQLPGRPRQLRGTRPSAASASASAAARQAGTMCPSYHGHARGEALDARPGAPALGDAPRRARSPTAGRASRSRRRSTCACPARAARADCPVNVDMATYKAEFLSHYYEGRLRPRHAYAMGLIYWWARLASQMPGAGQLRSARRPCFAASCKVAGRHRDASGRCRASPTRPSRTGCSAGPSRNQATPPVMLWADTFNNHFLPQVAKAAVEVLEDAGFQVLVPSEPLCCGRPLYDFGMLDRAKRYLREILDRLRPEIERACRWSGSSRAARPSFATSSCNLFPHDEDAKRLRRPTRFMLSRVSRQEGRELPGRRFAAKPSSTVTATTRRHEDGREEEVLHEMGLDFELLDSGCCGMAGSFGFEARALRRFAGGRRARASAGRAQGGEGYARHRRRLQLPRADRRATDRGVLHLAQVLQMALHEGEDGPDGAPPENRVRAPGQVGAAPTPGLAVVALGIGVLVGFGLVGIAGRLAGGRRA